MNPAASPSVLSVVNNVPTVDAAVSRVHWREAQFTEVYPELLSLLVEDAPLPTVLSQLVQFLRKLRGPSTRAAIFVHDPASKALRHGASVGIEPGYTQAVDGFPVEACKPACGSAVFYGRDELVEDVCDDPKWRPYLHLATEFGFRACWSFVLSSSAGDCLGTLALYQTNPCLPTAQDAEQVRYFARTAALLIERHLKEERQRTDTRELEAYRRSAAGADATLSVVAHELRNPLSAVRNAVHALQFGGEQPVLREKALEVLDRQARQMEWLVEDLIDADRASRNMLKLKMEEHNLEEVLRFAVESVNGQIEGKQQAVVFANSTRRDLRVQADYRRLAQVFGNLLGNASKFSPAQGVIRIGIAAEGTTATVSIEDAGIGLKPEDTRRIFQMFEQVENGQRGGLGIGLALVQRLTELHGGAVRADSRGLDQGSVFSVTLPILGGDAQSNGA